MPFSLRSMLSAVVLAAVLCGCTSNPVSQTWPITKMVDPVTEETPHVIVNP